MSTNPYHLAIGRTTGTDFLVLGSGTLIGPDHVLTATHIFSDARGLEVRIADGPNTIPCTVEVSRPQEELDITVLRLARPVTSDFAQLKGGRVLAETAVEMQGFPYVAEGSKQPGFDKVGAKTRSYNMGETYLLLDAPNKPDVWKGLSGAGVVADKQVIGVFRGYRTGYKGERCTAIPVARFFHQPWFREAMGLPNSDSEYVRRIADVLSKWDGLHQLLRAALQLAGTTATDTAAAFSQLSAREGVSIADDVMDALRKEPVRNKEEEGALRSIVNEWLPRAVDWAEVDAQVKAARVGGKSEIELPFRLETIAEVVCARSEGRPCEFVPLNNTPALTGFGFLSWPSSDYAPIRRTEKVIKEALIEKLRVHFPAIQSGTPESMFGAIEVRLQSAIKRPRERSHPLLLSLLVVDDMHGGEAGGLEAWSLVTRPGVCPPSLRLIRLKGGAKEHAKDTEIAEPLEWIHRKD
jgi:hypothetical protein